MYKTEPSPTDRFTSTTGQYQDWFILSNEEYRGSKINIWNSDPEKGIFIQSCVFRFLWTSIRTYPYHICHIIWSIYGKYYIDKIFEFATKFLTNSLTNWWFHIRDINPWYPPMNKFDRIINLYVSFDLETHFNHCVPFRLKVSFEPFSSIRTSITKLTYMYIHVCIFHYSVCTVIHTVFRLT